MDTGTCGPESIAIDCSDSKKFQKHPVYWFDDGSLVLHVQDTLYKVHDSLLRRHSPFLASVDIVSNATIVSDVGNASYVLLGSDRAARPKDVEALLEHMYHDFPLGPDAPCDRVFSVLRSSSPKQLDIPSLHTLAKERLGIIFADQSTSEIRSEHLHEALSLAKEFDLPSIRRIALYQIMVSAMFDIADQDVTALEDASRPDPPEQTSFSSVVVGLDSSALGDRYMLAEADIQLCRHLMDQAIEHFTPILFTPATTRHMACTDVFADMWMSLVIQPAIEDGGVYKPIETLERIKKIDWVGHGLCSACVVEKREEWTEEQNNVWLLVEKWLKEKDATV